MSKRFVCFLVAGQLLGALGAAAAEKASDAEVFGRALKEYRRYPEYHHMLEKGEGTYNDVNAALIEGIPGNLMQPRYKQFNESYLKYQQQEAELANNLKKLQKSLDETPISNTQLRPKLEVNLEAAKGQHKKLRYFLFLLSVDANTSFLEAMQAVPAEKKAELAKPKAGPVVKVPMPGIFQESASDRARKKAEDKPNLTPVDPEFYATQLGQKLERDLGARADAWSYDFGKDELYVQVAGQVSKLRVKVDAGNARFIQTRVGKDFLEPRGADTKVDGLTAKGRFMTGKSDEETLFGPMTSGGAPKFVNENKGRGEQEH